MSRSADRNVFRTVKAARKAYPAGLMVIIRDIVLLYHLRRNTGV